MTLALLLGLPLAALWLATLVALLLNRDPPELRTRVNGRYLKSLTALDAEIAAAHCTWKLEQGENTDGRQKTTGTN